MKSKYENILALWKLKCEIQIENYYPHFRLFSYFAIATRIACPLAKAIRVMIMLRFATLFYDKIYRDITVN